MNLMYYRTLYGVYSHDVMGAIFGYRGSLSLDQPVTAHPQNIKTKFHFENIKTQNDRVCLFVLNFEGTGAFLVGLSDSILIKKGRKTSAFLRLAVENIPKNKKKKNEKK